MSNINMVQRLANRLYIFKAIIAANDDQVLLPLYGSISAGFPSPADDYLEDHLDIGQHLVQNPSATFFIRVQGHSMIEANINPDDILIIDRSLTAKHGDIIVAVINTEFTVKRLYHKNKMLKLLPANPDYNPIEISDTDDFEVWGVVRYIIHKPI